MHRVRRPTFKDRKCSNIMLDRRSCFNALPEYQTRKRLSKTMPGRSLSIKINLFCYQTY